ncbi:MULTISPECIES: hypothetical protein [Pseudomonas]|jgi:hypothetical protein|uniref:Uncharacterized protein n=1 Tax=Pseudomonas folii TaxID=2762593 RepID=A0ABR7B118_9PSED|nr:MULTISPECIES: hypothetical protein [Pseudomonas]MBC3950878.1 hypothetical protein [Pseudomonas folii]
MLSEDLANNILYLLDEISARTEGLDIVQQLDVLDALTELLCATEGLNVQLRALNAHTVTKAKPGRHLRLVK